MIILRISTVRCQFKQIAAVEQTVSLFYLSPKILRSEADYQIPKKPRENRFLSFFICVNLWLILFASSTFAQTIAGTVTDTNNAPIQNAAISVKTKNKTITQTQTDSDGRFSIISDGGATLEVAAKGLANYEKPLREIDLNAPLIILLQPQNLREDVTVSITRTASRLSETPASVVVLDKQTLNETAAQAVDDSLRQIAGFTLFRRSSSKTANPTTQGANLRGLSGSGAARAAVTLDGLSLNDAFGGWTFWSRVPQIAVEQAEVLRGGASVFDGDTALSGAVNLITKQAAEDAPILRFETSAGTQKTFDGSVFAAYGKRGWNANLALESFQTAGYIPTAGAERGAIDTRANSRHQNGFLTVGKNFSPANPQNKIFVKTNIFSERRDNGTSLTNNRAYFRQFAFGADYANDVFGAFQFRAYAEKQIYDQTFSAVSNNRNTETLSRIQRVPSQAVGANLFWGKSFGARHVLSASGEIRQVRGFSDENVITNNAATSIVGAGGKEQNYSVFAQDFWRVTDKLKVNFGGRFDVWENADAFSSTRNLANNQTNTVSFANRKDHSFSPRIAALYQINRDFSAVASYSKSFRAPTLNELYRAFRVGNVLTTANENLRAERADTYETGVNFIGFKRKLNLRGNFFIAEVSRPVVSVTLLTTPNLITRQRQNVGQTRSHGLEFDAEYAPFANLKLSASFLAVDSRVTDFPADSALVDKFLPQIPKRQLTFQAAYHPQSKLTLSMQSRFSAAQFEDDANTLKLCPFSNFDAFASYEISAKVEIFAAAENITDNRYDIGLTPNLTVAAPRFVRVGLRFDLGNK